MSEIVECSNVGSCGYGIKDKLVVYPLFEAQYDFIIQQQADIKELAKALDLIEREVSSAYFKKEPVLIYSGTLEEFRALAAKHLEG